MDFTQTKPQLQSSPNSLLPRAVSSPVCPSV